MYKRQVIGSAASSIYASNTADPSKTLIVYFGQKEDHSGTDTVAGASIVVDNGKVFGNTEYVANIIKNSIGGDLFEIKTEKPYPTAHDPLIEYARKEEEDRTKPKLATHIPDISKYDTIFIGYPIWWYDMPMAFYSFFDEYDLSGKNIVLFCTHGGSRFTGTIEKIAKEEPNAIVNKEGLSISRNNVDDSKEDVEEWLKKLGYLK